MKTVARVSILLVLSLHPTVAFSWGDIGHQTVARIAARKLTPAARLRIAQILRAASTDDLNLKPIVGTTGTPSAAKIEAVLIKMAIWPDHMPGGKGATEPWHFVDIGLFEGPTHLHERCGQAGCVSEKITTLVTNVKTNQPLTVTEAGETVTFGLDRELRFLIHFVGDIHQPLHCATDADAGGNCIQTHGFSGTQLHHVWDTPLLLAAIMDTVAITHPNDPAGDIIKEFKAEAGTVASETDPAVIAGESFSLAKTSVYAKTKPKAAPVIDHFVDLRPNECSVKAPAEIRALSVDGPASFDNATTRKLVREQLFKAGLRLATMLTGI